MRTKPTRRAPAPYRSKAKINVSKIVAQTKRTAPQLTGEERKRATEAEMLQRIDIVLGLLLSGMRYAGIVRFSAKKWGIESRQTDTYIAEARKLIQAESNKDRAEVFAEHVAYRRKLRGMAEDDGDWRAALAAAQDEAKLRDLYPTAKMKVEGWQDTVVRLLTEKQVTPEQVIADFGEEADELLAAAGIPRSAQTKQDREARETSPTE